MSTHVKATSRYAHVAPNKVRQVVMHIRGRRVEEARRVLLLSPKAVSEQILKTLNSAVANAENNHDLDADDLYVTAAIVDEGPMMKRFQPRAMGRAYRIRKRTSHITISVGPENVPPPRGNHRLGNLKATATAPVADAATDQATPKPTKAAAPKAAAKSPKAPAATEAPQAEDTAETTTVVDEPVATEAPETTDETTGADAPATATAADPTDDTPAADADTKE